MERIPLQPVESVTVTTIIDNWVSGKAFEPIIERTVEAIAALEPEIVVPAHCTGTKAHQALARRLPEAYWPNAVGATFEL